MPPYSVHLQGEGWRIGERAAEAKKKRKRGKKREEIIIEKMGRVEFVDVSKYPVTL